MKTIKAIEKTEYSLYLIQYPNEKYVVGYSTKNETKTTYLMEYLGEAMDVFDGIYDHLETGGDLQ